MGGMCSCMIGGKRGVSERGAGAGEGGGSDMQRTALLGLVEELYAMLRPDVSPVLLDDDDEDDAPPPLAPDSAAAGVGNRRRRPDATVYEGFPKETMEKDITAVAQQADLTSLINLAARELLKQPTVLDLAPPLQIVGDLHGQFQDLLRIFDRIGYPPETRYLFLGDYVDRGPHSIEVMVLLLSLKILYPDSVYLLRGNHECEGVSMVYGFYEECKSRYRASLWRNFVHVFDAMPIAAVVEAPHDPEGSTRSRSGAGASGIHEGGGEEGNSMQKQRLFCVHAGLSPALDDLSALRKIRRPCKVHSDQIVSDLLWSDPGRKHGGWAYGDRGVSCTYGMDVAKQFLDANKLTMLVRAHEVVDNGYQVLGPGDGLVATVFSVPGYAGVCTNDAAVLEVNSKGEKRWHVLPFADRPKARPATGLEMPGKRDSMVLHNSNKDLTELLEQDRSLPRSDAPRSSRFMARMVEKALEVRDSLRVGGQDALERMATQRYSSGPFSVNGSGVFTGLSRHSSRGGSTPSNPPSSRARRLSNSSPHVVSPVAAGASNRAVPTANDVASASAPVADVGVDGEGRQAVVDAVDVKPELLGSRPPALLALDSFMVDVTPDSTPQASTKAQQQFAQELS